MPFSAHFLASLPASDTPFGLRIERSGAWLVRAGLAALDSETRRRGLLGRDSLGDGEGLIIAPSQGVHTFGMRFSIDVVGVARDGRVVKLRHAVRPRRIVLSLASFAILELPAGAAARAGLIVGDRLVVGAAPVIPADSLKTQLIR